MKIRKAGSSGRTLILDGYNVIHAISSLEKYLNHNLQAARQALIRYCSAYRISRGDLSRVVIVFDGQSRYAGPWGSDSSMESGIEIIFSDEQQKADDKIIELIHHAPPRDWVVISNDNYVTNNSRAHGVSVVSVEQFRAAVENSFEKSKNKVSGSSGTLSPEQAQAITQSYKRHLGIP